MHTRLGETSSSRIPGKPGKRSWYVRLKRLFQGVVEEGKEEGE